MKTQHKPASQKTLAELKRRAKRHRIEQRGKFGDMDLVDGMVQSFIVAIHQGTFPLPERVNEADDASETARRVLELVYLGDLDGLRRIGEAARRVWNRAQFSATAELSFAPARPELLEIVRAATLGGTVSVSIDQIQKHLASAGYPLSRSQCAKLKSELGMKAAKPGRPKGKRPQQAR